MGGVRVIKILQLVAGSLISYHKMTPLTWYYIPVFTKDLFMRDPTQHNNQSVINGSTIYIYADVTSESYGVVISRPANISFCMCSQLREVVCKSNRYTQLLHSSVYFMILYQLAVVFIFLYSDSQIFAVVQNNTAFAFQVRQSSIVWPLCIFVYYLSCMLSGCSTCAVLTQQRSHHHSRYMYVYAKLHVKIYCCSLPLRFINHQCMVNKISPLLITWGQELLLGKTSLVLTLVPACPYVYGILQYKVGHIKLVV